MHDVVVVGIPLIAILAGILFSRSDIKSLRDEMLGNFRDLRNEMNGELNSLRSEMREYQAETRNQLNRIDADLRQFYHLTGSLEARMDAIEKK